MIKTKLVSSLEKCFPDSDVLTFKPLTGATMLQNQRLSVQLFYTSDDDSLFMKHYRVGISGGLAEYAHIRYVRYVPVSYTVNENKAPDDNYLRTEPGLYPDWLEPLHYRGRVTVRRGIAKALWIDIDPMGAVAGGIYDMEIKLTSLSGDVEVISHKFTVKMIPAMLPEQEMKLTQWFHCDSLAHYYDCEPWSEKHWTIVENFAKVAVKNGINLLLTPVFTPPLDTYVGGERLTCQLVDVKYDGEKYSFGYKKLDRWVEMCNRVGIKFFEISHLFTQWGAQRAPKIMATVNGEYKKIFGWDTDAVGEKYRKFLSAFLPSFLRHMKKSGNDKRCLFHISDEPSLEQLDSYKAAKASVAKYLKDYTIMDAMSHVDFYKQGIADTPIPGCDSIEPFIAENIKGLWTYYCCGQSVNVSNRFLCMPLWRTRSIGMQLFKYNIAGFLQWGFNFYNNCGSHDSINPYTDANGENWVPAGDPFSVYPAQDGTAYESIRIISFHEALEDMRAMKLAERYYGHDAVVAEIEKVFGEVRFSKCAHCGDEILAVREAVNNMIEKAIGSV